MNEAEIFRTLREHFEALFPKVCPNCNHCFATIREYILITQRIGPTISYDAELGNWNTLRPIGTLLHANCPCGTTLALSSEGMALPRRQLLLNWIRIETQRRGLSPQELLDYLRDEIRKQILAEPGQETD